MLRSLFKNISLLFLAELFLSSCYYHKEEDMHPPKSGCDTLNVSYSTAVKKIIQDNCYSCHSTAATSTSGGLDLENFTSLKTYLNNQYHQDGIYGSKFYHVIDQVGLVPYMPPTGKLSFCDLRKIENWLSAGGPSN